LGISALAHEEGGGNSHFQEAELTALVPFLPQGSLSSDPIDSGWTDKISVRHPERKLSSHG